MKRLVLLCDGMWDRATGKSPTNVRKLCGGLADKCTPADGSSIAPLPKYLEGVGTSPLNRLPGGMFGLGISDKIKAGLRVDLRAVTSQAMSCSSLAVAAERSPRAAALG